MKQLVLKMDLGFKKVLDKIRCYDYNELFGKLKNVKVPTSGGKSGGKSGGGFKLYGSRPMKFPYTFTAKFVQFPWKFHFDTNWYYKYYVFGVIGSIPIFAYLTNLSYSPENVKKWEEIKKHEMEEHLHKFD